MRFEEIRSVSIVPRTGCRGDVDWALGKPFQQPGEIWRFTYRVDA